MQPLAYIQFREMYVKYYSNQSNKITETDCFSEWNWTKTANTATLFNKRSKKVSVCMTERSPRNQLELMYTM